VRHFFLRATNAKRYTKNPDFPHFLESSDVTYRKRKSLFLNNDIGMPYFVSTKLRNSPKIALKMSSHLIVVIAAVLFAAAAIPSSDAFSPSARRIISKSSLLNLFPSTSHFLADAAPWDKEDLFSRAVDGSAVAAKVAAKVPVASSSTSEAAAFSSSSTDPLVLAVVLAVVAGGVIAVSSLVNGGEGQGSSTTAATKQVKEEAEPEKIDISIPYNAAAKLMYEQEGYANTTDFKTFEKMYIKNSVAKVTAKKVARDAEQTVALAKKEAEAAASELQSLLKK